ncbi:MAG TPA: hypothetical protein VM936_02185 [Pyrinomonadaceae bacterium]|jgi:hypothetical protein|nr:hypothetical protein [Pyrinomonadaceae bacterium]
MDELDAEWERRVAEAAQRARAAGRRDVADYIALRAANDLARAVGVAWLLDLFTALADEAMLRGADLRLARDDAHSFRAAHSTMTGGRLTLSAGLVRTLSVEAGWPRTPRDGIVRGNGLARARLTHFGDRAPDEELLLVRAGEAAPRWLTLSETGARTDFDESRAREHLAKLIG